NLPSRFLDEMPKEYIEEHDLRRNARMFRKRHSEGALATEESLTESGSSFDDDFNQELPKKLYSSGERVRHSSFGVGVICRVEGEEEHTKLTIKFDSGYVKKFIATQAPLQKL
ncbi:MAG: hypothetical protein AAB309_04445, partial [Deltaproteobacteria bacterium]